MTETKIVIAYTDESISLAQVSKNKMKDSKLLKNSE